MTQNSEPMKPTGHFGWPAKSLNMAAVTAFIASITVLIVAFSLSRDYFDYGTETDYLSGFILEAQRLLSGEPLALEFHPPAYAAVIAITNSLFDDWFVTGLFVSSIAAVVTLVCSYALFSGLFGAWAGWGSIICLGLSYIFQVSASSATSDVFFLALLFASCATALAAINNGTLALWCLSGALTGVAILTRANGITLILLALAPWISNVSMSRKLNSFAAFAVCLAAPILAWITYGTLTGSPLAPTKAYLNLAMTYFSVSEDRASGDALRLIKDRFTNVQDVLMHDPIAMAKIYVSDMKALILWDLQKVVLFPFFYLFVPGAVLLLLKRHDRTVFIFGLLVVAQVLLVNLKTFEGRFYLFILPFAGAAGGEVVRRVTNMARPNFLKLASVGFFGMAVLAGIVLERHDFRKLLGRDSPDLAEIVPMLEEIIPEGARVVARKGHVPYYARQAERIYFPAANTLDEFQEALRAEAGTGPIFVYLGPIEQRARRRLAEALTHDNPPDWLEIVASSNQPGLWFLYRYVETPSN